MNRAEAEAFLYSQLANQCQQPQGAGLEQVGTGGEIDSLLGLELILTIEERYGIRFADDELTPRRLRSIPNLAQAMVSKSSS